MNEETGLFDTKHGLGFGAVWVWSFVAILVYVLSVGPAVRVMQRSEHSLVRRAFVTIYTPLAWLRRTPLQGPLCWYIDLWIDRSLYRIALE
jgi:hypothetical protein